MTQDVDLLARSSVARGTAAQAQPDIPEFFRGRTVLVTGATGFMGKVLVEKLLRSCPDIDTIYALIRHKRGKSPADRLVEYLASQVSE